jgi:Uma2 family endonuclease
METVPAPTTTLLPPPPASDLYRFDIDEFERISAFLRADRVELIDGFIVERDVMEPPHVLASEILRRLLEQLNLTGWFVREDKPLRVHGGYEPLPDLAIVRGMPATYAMRHPNTADVAIVIEIADFTLLKDRGEKSINYARGGVAFYWIVNLADRQIEVYTDPSPDGFSASEIFTVGDWVPVVVDGITIGIVPVFDVVAGPRISP